MGMEAMIMLTQINQTIKLFWWRLRYAVLAMWVIHCKPSFAWGMATADDTGFKEGDSPREALDEELSYWTEDGD